MQDNRKSRKHDVYMDKYIIPAKLLDVVASIPDGEDSQHIDDSNSGDDVEFDNNIDIIFKDDALINKTKMHCFIM